MMLQPMVAMTRLSDAPCRRIGRNPNRSITYESTATASPERTNSTGIGSAVRVASV
jgi:hypothetical protein